MPNDITLPQVALRLGLSWHAAYKLVTQGELGPARQVGNRWYVGEPGVSAYIDRTREPEITAG